MTEQEVAELRAQLRALSDDELRVRCHSETDKEVLSYLYGERHRRDRVKVYRRQCGVPELWRGMLLETVIPQRAQQGAVKALKRIHPGSKGLYLYGPAGHGKSYLGACWVQTMVERGYPAKYIRWMDLLADIRSRMDYSSDHSGPDLLNIARTTPALLLDDLGAGRVTSWAIGIAEEVMDVRIGASLTTVVTSNLWPAGNPKVVATVSGVLSARIASRMAELCRGYRLQGEDQRAGGGR